MKKRSKIDADIGIHMGDEIRKELNKQKRSVAWLADEIEHDSSNLNKQLSSQYIHSKWLYRISRVFKKDFFAFYSQKLANEKHTIREQLS